MRNQQSGVMLLEAMIAILVFSLGVLGIVGMQASAIAASRDAKYRTDAGLLANEIIGAMWSSNRDGDKLREQFQGDCDDGNGLECDRVANPTDLTNPYVMWRQRVLDTLPGRLAPFVYVGTPCPPVPGTPSALGNIGPTPPRTSTLVCITVRWQAPNDNEHNYRVSVEII